jgi:hypothetical protein
VSAQHGFMLAAPPPLALPPSHRACDEAAAALPALWRDLTARAVLGSELPHLPADPGALPDAMLWRASAVLGAIAYSFVRCDDEHMHELAPIEIPAHIAQPWTQVAARMGRKAPLLAYDDLFTHNYRLLDHHAPDPIRLENLRLLVPLLGNDAERAFFGVKIEIQARLTPIVDAAVRAQEAVVARDRDGVVAALLTILGAVRDATSHLRRQARVIASARARPASICVMSHSGSAPMRSSRARRSTVAICVTLTTESAASRPMSMGTATFPGSAASWALVVSAATVTVRSAERLYESALMTTTGRRNAGAEPLGSPRSAHQTSPRLTAASRPRAPRRRRR